MHNRNKQDTAPKRELPTLGNAATDGASVAQGARRLNAFRVHMTSKVPSDRVPATEARTGFQAQIKGATLSDLVQMECLSGTQRVVRVTSGSHVGYLYFRGGAVVHAVARSLAGDAAAFEILSWNDGSFEAIEREWPIKDTISSGWQSLLLRAAQARDERAVVPGIVTLRGEGRPPRPKAPAAETMEFQATPLEVAGRVLRGEDFEAVVRLDSDGSVTLCIGASQDFADVVAYACRLAELIGTQIGAERFVAMECVFKHGRCFVVLDKDGDVVALRPHPAADCGPIRVLLGL